MNSFWFIIFFVFLVVADRRQCRNWVMNNQPTLLIFLVFHIKHLNLFLLLLSWDERFRWWKSFIVVLNDDLNDWFEWLLVLLWGEVI